MTKATKPTKAPKSEVTMEYGCLKIDGKYYEATPDGLDRLRYVEVSKKKFDEKVSVIKKIADKLKNSLDREAVLMEALSKLSEEELSGVWTALNNPLRKLKPKTRRHHCVDMKIGNWVIPIVN